MALAETGLVQIEEFGILVSIFNQVNPIKSEAIFNNLMGLSSGTNMLTRLKRRGMISEYQDKQLCIQMLNPIDTRFSAVIQKQKNKRFDEVYDENDV